METFNPDPKPSIGGASTATTARNHEALLGDGYSQRAPRGLNSLQRTVTLRWDYLSPAEALAIESFFVARNGVEAFRYQPENEPISLVWSCKEWGRDPNTQTTISISAKLTQEFDLA